MAPESEREVYWPADILPFDVPRARIWTYDADGIDGSSHQSKQGNLINHANHFKVKLARLLTDDVCSRPCPALEAI